MASKSMTEFLEEVIFISPGGMRETRRRRTTPPRPTNQLSVVFQRTAPAPLMATSCRVTVPPLVAGGVTTIA